MKHFFNVLHSYMVSPSALLAPGITVHKRHTGKGLLQELHEYIRIEGWVAVLAQNRIQTRALRIQKNG